MSDLLNNQKKLSSVETMRHSAAHVLAAAVLQMFPEAKFGIGPVIENGFYYDVSLPRTLIPEDLPLLEEKMRTMIAANHPFERVEIPLGAARERFEKLGQTYKVEILDDLGTRGETAVSLYKTGDFVDLCTGPHIDSTGEINPAALRLTKISGAYWKGDATRDQLQRIYGVAFEKPVELDEHLALLAEAEKRDHRKIGKELDLFTFSGLVGSGLPLYTPKGTVLRDQLIEFSENLQRASGFQKVWTPHITKTDLYKKSGHWDKFGQELMLVKSQETDDAFALKPMNCPHHTQLYAAHPRSYRDLPLRYMETATVYRDEKTGELSGLMRVRSLTQDDAHVFCTMDQVENEFENIMSMIKALYAALGLSFHARLSFHDAQTPERYLGDTTQWTRAEEIIERVAKNLQLDYTVARGEAAFYGPKIDIMVIDALSRQWQCATQQLDFVQPSRFDLSYVAADGSKQTPVMIHKALLGTIDRFIGIYIEHTAGIFPLWLSPLQVAVIPVSEKFAPYARAVAEKLRLRGIRTEISDENETLGKRIGKAQHEKVPYMVIVGGKEEESATVSVRSRAKGDEGTMTAENFAQRLDEEIGSRA